MKELSRIILGVIIALCGIGIIFLSGRIVVQEQSLEALLLFIFIFGIGFALGKLGYVIATRKKIKEALTFLFFLGNRLR